MHEDSKILENLYRYFQKPRYFELSLVFLCSGSVSQVLFFIPTKMQVNSLAGVYDYIYTHIIMYT
jgi:hypothetical protein